MSSEETVFSRRTHRDIDEALAWLDELSSDQRRRSGGRGRGSDLPTWLRSDLRLEAPAPPGVQAPPLDDNLSWLDGLVSGLGAPIEEAPTTSWEDSAVFERPGATTATIDDPLLRVLDVASTPAEPVAAPANDRRSEEIIPDLPELDLTETADALVADDDTFVGAAPAALAVPVGDAPIEGPTVVSEMPLSERWEAGDLDLDMELEALLGEAGQRRAPETPQLRDEDLFNPSAIPDDPDEAIAWLEQMARREKQRRPLGYANKPAAEFDPEEDSLVLEPPPFDEALPDDEVAQALRDLGEEMGIEPPAGGRVSPAVGKPADEIEAFMRDLESGVPVRAPEATAGERAAPDALAAESAAAESTAAQPPAADEGTLPPPAPARAQLPEDVSEALAWLEQLVAGHDTPLDETTLELASADVNELLAQATGSPRTAAATIEEPPPPAADEAAAWLAELGVAAPPAEIVEVAAALPDESAAAEATHIAPRPPAAPDALAAEPADAPRPAVRADRSERDAVIAELMGYDADAALDDDEYAPTLLTFEEAPRAVDAAPASLDAPAAVALDDLTPAEPTLIERQRPAAEQFAELIDPEAAQRTLFVADNVPPLPAAAPLPAADPAEHQPTLIVPQAADAQADTLPPTLLELPPSPAPAAADDAEQQRTLLEPPAAPVDRAAAGDRHDDGGLARRLAAEADDDGHVVTMIVPRAAPSVVTPDDTALAPDDELGAALAWLERYAADHDGSSVLEPAASAAPTPVEVGVDFGEQREQAAQAAAQGDFRRAADHFAAVLASAHPAAAELVAGDVLHLLAQESAQPILFRVLGDAYGQQQQYQKAAEAYRRGLEML